VDGITLRLLVTQQGRCAICRGLLLHADREPQSPREWEQWRTATRKAMTNSYLVLRDNGTPDETKPRLVHTHCQRRRLAANGTGPVVLHVCEPSGLA
jgi:RNA-directed DNA polymerase